MGRMQVEIIKFGVQQDLWIQRQKTPLYRARLSLKWNIHKYQWEDEHWQLCVLYCFNIQHFPARVN